MPAVFSGIAGFTVLFFLHGISSLWDYEPGEFLVVALIGVIA